MITPAAIAEIEQAVQAWREAHPHATCDEIETKVQQQWAPLQAQLLVAAMAPGPMTHSLEAEARPSCPQCQHRLQARGYLGVAGHLHVHLHRYAPPHLRPWRVCSLKTSQPSRPLVLCSPPGLWGTRRDSVA